MRKTRTTSLGLAVFFASLLTVGADGATPVFSSAGTASARVFVVEDQEATESYTPRRETLDRMVAKGLKAVTGEETPEQAWGRLVNPQDVIGLKIFASPGRVSGTRRTLVEAVIQSLLDAGIAPGKIVVWDKHHIHLRLGGYLDLIDQYGVRVVGSSDAGYDRDVFYESEFVGPLVYGDLDFGDEKRKVSRKSYVTKLVTREITKIVTITPLLNHNMAGVTGHLFSLALGSVDNTVRFMKSQSELSVAVPEIFALPQLGDRVVLNITDGLFAQYFGEARTLLHYSGVLNQLLFSTDPVALDVVSLLELKRQRQTAQGKTVKVNMTLYQNASLVEIGISDPRRIAIRKVD